ncbi:MAG TPA: 3'(2'),5'-bisphosphate nucleotidase CysQ [Xanthobacteraceae bacterium]|nr:3'(2'),5'-bisphosphate nucleotidase CysQ [Xanthobacteraceae bacterium]
MPPLNAAASAELMDVLTTIIASAAQAILRESSGKGDVHIKADRSPVTAADEAAEAVICDGLKRLVPNLPVISEEQVEHDKPIVGGASVILVDPLDGTRDFIAGRDEYTINIALVTDGAPILGIIAAPALGLIWRGIVGRGAERMEFADDGKTSRPRAIHTRQPPASELIVMVSRSHLEAQTRAYVEALPQARLIPCGSALKFCRIAEGTADHYPRLAPTCDWDVGAGHAILKAAGGSVIAPNGGPIVYGTQELRIPAFLAWGDIRG